MKTARNGWWLISAGWILLTGPFLGSENIQLPEEYIYGQDLSVWKSEIMFLPAPEVKIDFPPLPLPEWSTEVPPVQEATAPETAASIARPLETFPVEPERERWVRVTAGQNQTLGLLWVHQDKTSSFSWSLSGGVENSAGWRAHQNKNISNLSCRLEPLSRYGPFFQVETLIGRQQLPGPLWAPLTEIRNTFGFSGWYQQQLEDHPFLLSARERYYQMDELQANYLKLAGKLTRQSWQWSSEVEWQEIKKAGSQTGLLTELALEKEAFSLGLGLKGIQGTGLRLLPRAEVHLNRNLKFSLTSYYQIADFWGEAGKSDYLEIKPERLKPQEGYRLAAGYLSSNSCGWFSFDAGYTWWNHFYTWSDQDGNFLYEPALIRHLWATDLNLRAGFKLTRDAGFFFRAKQLFFDRKIQYWPGTEIATGLTWERLPFSGNLGMIYCGRRRFPGQTLGGYTSCYVDFSWRFKPGVLFGISVENLTGVCYQEVPGYPGRGRYFSSRIQVNF